MKGTHAYIYMHCICAYIFLCNENLGLCCLIELKVEFLEEQGALVKLLSVPY